MGTYEEDRRDQAVPKIIEIEPWAWKDEWDERPRQTIAVGLRGIGADDYQRAYIEALKYVSENCEGLSDQKKLDVFTIQQQCWLIASGVCDPNDIRVAFFSSGDEQVCCQLRPEGLRYLFDEIETLHLEESVTAPEADEEDLLTLAEVLAAGTTLPRLPEIQQRQARRLLRYVLDKMIELVPPESQVDSASASPPGED